MAAKGRPIRPNEVVGEKKVNIPKVVFDCFNTLIIMHFNNGNATIKQEDVVALLVKERLNRAEIFDKHWLDVEKIYESAGWKVDYDKPGYNESYPATLTF